MGFKALRELLARHIKQGGSPQALSASVALGSVLGLFPIPGVATFMCLVVAVVFRLNAVVLQAANYAVYPLQIGMLGVYYALGNLWFGPIGVLPELSSLPDLALRDLVAVLAGTGQMVLPIVGAWLLTSPLIVLTLYGVVRPAMFRLMPTPICKPSTPNRPGSHQRRKLCAQPLSGSLSVP